MTNMLQVRLDDAIKDASAAHAAWHLGAKLKFVLFVPDQKAVDEAHALLVGERVLAERVSRFKYQSANEYPKLVEALAKADGFEARLGRHVPGTELLRADGHVHRHVCGHVHRHVCGHVHRHVCGHVHRHVNRHVHRHVC